MRIISDYADSFNFIPCIFSSIVTKMNSKDAASTKSIRIASKDLHKQKSCSLGFSLTFLSYPMSDVVDEDEAFSRFIMLNAN